MCEERDRITAIVRVQRPKQGIRRSEARADASHPRAYRIVIVLAPLNVPLCPALRETGDMAGDTTSSAGWFTSTRSERTLNFYLLHFIFAYVCINWRHTLCATLSGLNCSCKLTSVPKTRLRPLPDSVQNLRC